MAASYSNITINATATSVLPGNSARRGFLIQNNSAVVVYIGFDSSVSTTNGVLISSGGNYINTGDYECYRGPYYAIAASGTADCRYQEWTP